MVGRPAERVAVASRSCPCGGAVADRGVAVQGFPAVKAPVGSGRCRARMRRLAGPGLVCGCAVGGACLVALPWLRPPRPHSLPAEWGRGSRTHALVMAAAGTVDRACRTGDVDALGRATTTRYLAGLQELLRQGGRRLDGASLAEQKVHVGGIAQLPLLVGVAGSDAAVAVFARERTGIEHEAQAQALLALRFAWDGFELRLDDKASRTVAPGESLAGQARSLAKRLLAER